MKRSSKIKPTGTKMKYSKPELETEEEEEEEEQGSAETENESEEQSLTDETSPDDENDDEDEDEAYSTSGNGEDDEEEKGEEDDSEGNTTTYKFSEKYGFDVRRSTRKRKQPQFSSDSEPESYISSRTRSKTLRGRNQPKRKKPAPKTVQKKNDTKTKRRGMYSRMSLRQHAKTRSLSTDEYSTPETETETYTEDESYDEEEEQEEVIQYIIGKKDVFTDHMNTDTTDTETEEDEYYVKFQGKAYLHCRYMKLEEILNTEGGENAYKRWTKISKNSPLEHSMSFPSLLTFPQTEPNSLWVEVDRIIDEAGDGQHRKYHVVWKGLNYDQSTWEKEADIPKEKVDQFHKRLDHSNPIVIPSRYKRPSPDSFKEIDEPIKDNSGELTLRPYQMEGFNWLRFCWYNQRNSILADEMGLGKTVQVVTALNDLALHENITGPFLIVAPLSTLPHWKMEFERWTDLNVVVYHGNQISRDLIRQTEFVVVNESGVPLKNRVQFDVLITNPETMAIDMNTFLKIQWRYVVLDEAHKFKNPKGKLYQKMEELQFEHCVMLTGTPIQNRIEELWGLLHFLYPSKFNDLDEFKAKYDNPTSSEQVAEIQEIIKPIILRRKKSNVEKAILPKEETIIDVQLTKQQKVFYKALINKNAEFLLREITGGALPALQNLMMQLRKVCNHPYLIKGAEQSIIREKKEEYKNSGKSLEEIEMLAMIESSGKMILIDKLLAKLRADHHKVLIFSQMVRVLDIIQDYLQFKDYPNERIDGSKSDKERQESIDRFNRDENAFVFLLSTHAGGVGINLTSADTVIIYDSDWNPQNDIQAEARCHRIGQKSMVKIYRLIMKDTYEEKMFETASKKLGLDHAILDGDIDSSSDKNSKAKAREIEEILRNGIHNIFKDDDTEIDEFSKDDIDQILSRRAKNVVEDVVAGGGSVFAHAKFNVDSGNANAHDDNQDEEDPNHFWKDYLPQNFNGFNEHLTIRRCRKNQMERSASLETVAIRKSIKDLISMGYRKKNNEFEIIRYALNSINILDEMHQKLFIQVFGPLDPPSDDEQSSHEDDEASDLIYSAMLSRSDSISNSTSYSNLSVEDYKVGSIKEDSESAFYIDEKADQIIDSVLFFLRLRRCLIFIQPDSGFEWPLITPSWKGPDADYALLLAYHMTGKNKLLEYILNTPELNDTIQLKTDKDGDIVQTHILNNKSIYKRVAQMVEEIEKQFPPEFVDSNESTLLQSPSFPSECVEPNSMNPDEVEFVPMPPAVWKEKHQSTCMSRDTLYDFEVNDLVQTLMAYGLPLDESDEVDWPKLKDLAKLPYVSIQTIEEMVKQIIDLTEQKEPDLSQIPNVTEFKLRRIKSCVRDMEKIYKFNNKLNKDPQQITDLIRILDRFENISWWSYQCDVALIKSMAKYGLNKFAIWMIDQNLPFYEHIPTEMLEAFANLAALEKKKSGKQALKEDFNENMPPELALLKGRNRVDRVLSVIRNVNKKLESLKNHPKRKKKLEVLNTGDQQEPEEKVEIPKSHDEIIDESLQKLQNGEPLKITKEIELLDIGQLPVPYDKNYETKMVPFPIGYKIRRELKRKGWSKKHFFEATIEQGETKPVFRVTIIDAENNPSFTGDAPNIPWKLAFELIEPPPEEHAAENEPKRMQSIPGVTLFGLSAPIIFDLLSKQPESIKYQSFKKSQEKNKLVPINFSIKIPHIDIPEVLDEL